MARNDIPCAYEDEWTLGCSQPSYQLKSRFELRKIPRMLWKVKRVLPATGLAVVYGKPGVGKSFLLFDLGCAIAAGEPWFGHKTIASPVVYLCLEGMAGFVSRTQAWEKGHQRELPEHLYIVDSPFNLLNAQEVGALIRAINERLLAVPKNLGAPVVIIDTLNRAMVGGDENSSRDMGLVWQACGHIVGVTNGLVILSHHPGKESDRGPRGHSSVNATVDASILVTHGKEHRSWRSEKIKDGPATQVCSFELQPVELGQDEDGESITSCYVSVGGDVFNEGGSSEMHLTGNERIGLNSLRELSPNGMFIDISVWRSAFMEKVAADTESGKRNAFNRVKKSLNEKKTIDLSDQGKKVRLHGRTNHASLDNG